MTTNERSISVISPFTPAIERVKTLLFHPFDLERWLIFGFCAWLAMLGQSGGGGGNYNFGGRQAQNAREGLREAWEFIGANLYWIVPLVIGLALVGVAIWVVLTWLSSRGQFMFLHGVATNRAEVRVPLRRYAAHGNSLFRFRLVLGLLSFLLILPAVLGGLGLIFLMVLRDGPTVGLVSGTLLAFLAAIALGVLFSVIGKFTLDFVVPVMALRTARCRTAWGELLGLLRVYPATFLVYLLFQIVLAVAVGILVIAVVLLTCCCAGCLLAIPYVGTVLLLPILVFDRAYSLYYLAQFGPEYEVIEAGSVTLPAVSA